MPIGEALGVLLNTKFKQVTNVTSSDHSLYTAYNSWSYFIKSKLIPMENYDQILEDKEFGTIFVLLDNLTENPNTLKYEHSVQLLTDCLMHNPYDDFVNEFMFGTFIHILKIKTEETNYAVIQQYKYSICTFLIEFIIKIEFEPVQQEGSIVGSEDCILKKLGEHKTNSLLEALWFVTRFDSIVMDNRRCATKLTSRATDLILILSYFLSEYTNDLLYQNSDLFMRTITEVLHWFEPHRALYSECLKYFIRKLKQIDSLVTQIKLLERSSRTEDVTKPREGKQFCMKSLASFFNCYSYFMIESREYFNVFIRHATKLETSSGKQDILFEYIVALLVELEGSTDETQISFCLVCIVALVGKFRKKETKKYFNMSLKSIVKGKDITLFDMLIQITNNKLVGFTKFQKVISLAKIEL